MKALTDWVTPPSPSPGPEGLVTPLLGLAVLAAVAWRVAMRAYRQHGNEESDE